MIFKWFLSLLFFGIFGTFVHLYTTEIDLLPASTDPNELPQVATDNIEHKDDTISSQESTFSFLDFK